MILNFWLNDLKINILKEYLIKFFVFKIGKIGVWILLVNNKYLINDIDLEIGYIRQEMSIFPGTLFENIALQTTLDKNIESNILKILKVVNLDKKELNKNVQNYSIGELKRVEIARILFFKPKIIIMDEAFVGIDKSTKEKIISIIKTQFNNTFFIFISHDEKINLNNKEVKL